MNAVAAGTGNMKKEDRRKYMAQLARRAGLSRGRRLRTMADWQAAGISVEAEPKREE